MVTPVLRNPTRAQTRRTHIKPLHGERDGVAGGFFCFLFRARERRRRQMPNRDSWWCRRRSRREKHGLIWIPGARGGRAQAPRTREALATFYYRRASGPGTRRGGGAGGRGSARGSRPLPQRQGCQTGCVRVDGFAFCFWDGSRWPSGVGMCVGKMAGFFCWIWFFFVLINKW